MALRNAPTRSLLAGLLIFCSGAAIAALSGCDATSEAASGNPPQHASPESVIRTFNEFAMTVPHVSPLAINELIHGSSPLQRRYLSLAEAMAPVQQLEQAMWERFGETLEGPVEVGPLAPIRQAARLATVRDETATARFVDRLGHQRILHLVRIGNQWWIAGRTLESDPTISLMHESLTALAARHRYLSRVAPPIRARLIAGEFQTAEQVRNAVLEATRAAFPASKELESILTGNHVPAVQNSPGGIGDLIRPMAVPAADRLARDVEN